MARSIADGRAARLAAGALLALATACGGSDPAGVLEALGRSPSAHASPLTTGAGCPGADVHTRHLNLFACVTCHPTGATFGFDVPFTFPSGRTSTAGGTIVPATPTTPTTCTVACHFPMGAAPRSVAWSTPGPLACSACHDTSTLPPQHPAVAASATRDECQGCHVAGTHMDGAVALVGHDPSWMDRASPAFHAFSAERGLSRCQDCHGRDLSGGGAGVSCASCHAAGGVAANADFSTCTGCHGGTDDQSGAPPRALWGRADDLARIGAHTSHLAGSALAPPVACASCHVTPATLLSPGHVDELTDPAAVPSATVTFGGLALAGGAVPAYDATAGTCASTYCHGATLDGGSNTTPTWSVVDGSQAACGTCHGLPPGGTHPFVDTSTRGLAACSACHAETVDATGAVIAPSAGGKHLDGIVEGSGHQASWMDPASGEFHAYGANQGLSTCQACHGQDLAGGSVGVACASCHAAGGLAAGSDFSTCTGCHGGAENATGAPPRATWGQSADAVRVGAHTRHVTAGLARPFDCDVCHVKPIDLLSEGHVDGATATVTFGGVATTGAVLPVWDRASATCASTYCHGGFAGGNAANVPSWTAPVANACGTCHGLPPGGSHPANADCARCHDGYTAATVNAALHVNGSADVMSMTCTSCHGDPARAPTTRNPQLAAAPPIDTYGNSAPSAPGVGAHERHLQPSELSDPIACTECHVVPTSTTHADGVDDVAFGPLATASGALAPAWNPAALTCASTYCHGGFGLGNATYAPIWNAPAANACGTCHGIPPPAPHPENSSCGSCHRGYSATSVNLATHVNGRLDASGQACTSCHGDASRAATALNPALPSAPPVDVSGSSDPSSPGVGAHQVHLNGSALRGPLACTECHSVPADLSSHPSTTGEVAFAWGPLATGAIGASVAVTTGPRHFESLSTVTPTFASGTCSSTYCHGAYSGVYAYPVWDWGLDEAVTYYAAYAGKAATPSWTGGPLGCDSCHVLPPAAGPYWHSGNHGTVQAHNDCSVCHPDAAGLGSAAQITDPAMHVDGKVDLAPQFSSQCFGCH